MDKRGLSHYRQSLSEYQDVRQQISNAMQSVVLFAQQHKLNIEIAIQKLEKKFKILFNTDLDAINCLPISFKPHRHQEQLYLARTSLSSNWQINDMPAALSIQPLYQNPSLLNVLAWAVNNRLLTKATGLQLVDQRQKVKMALVLDLIQQLLQSPLITSADDITTLDVNEVAEIDTILLFANLENKAISSLNQQGLDLASLQTDPLNYANSKQSLIASVEGLIHSSWGHWHYVIYTGPTSLLELLGTIIQWQPHQKSAVEATCWCPSDNHGKKISQRIETVYSEVIAHYINHPLNGDYLIAIADHFYRLQWQQGLVDILPLVKNKSLEQHLAEQRDIFSASKLDPILDKDGLLQLILNQQVDKRISLFLLSKNNGVTLYLIDDLGTLFIQHTIGLAEATLTHHYQQFFSQINVITDVQFFHLTHSRMSGWKHTKITHFNISTTKPTYPPVRVELDSPQENAQCIIHCGSKSFTGSINDPDLFKQVGDLVLSLRNTTSRYPLYINQLSFIASKTYTTRHYIILKQQIENLLNKAENLSL
ncbi:MAG: class I adenylate cyclase [Pseudomonadota bacterium]|nr:class I adenylate cyclase [Pseudomonadota bacterium]